MAKLSGNTIQTQQYIFDDLYGSEYLKDKFSGNRNFTYFNYLLKIHNKYFTQETTYKDIFGQFKSNNGNQNQRPLLTKQRRRIKKSLTPTPMLHKDLLSLNKMPNQQTKKSLSFYGNVEVLNKHTFKISRSNNKITNQSHRQLILNKTLYPRNPEEPGKDILKDKKIIQQAMQTYNKERGGRTIGQEFRNMKQTMWNRKTKHQKNTIDIKSFFIGNSKVVAKHQRNKSLI